MKGTEDVGLRYAVQEWVFVTLDENLLKPGRFPAKQCGVFFLDACGSSALEVGASLCNTFRAHWRDDSWCANRRFVWSATHVEERALDNTVINRVEG